MAELSALQDYYIHFFREFRCGDCGSDVAYVSRPRTLTEKYFLPLVRHEDGSLRRLLPSLHSFLFASGATPGVDTQGTTLANSCSSGCRKSRCVTLAGWLY